MDIKHLSCRPHSGYMQCHWAPAGLLWKEKGEEEQLYLGEERGRFDGESGEKKL